VVTAPDLTGRYDRQRDIVPAERLAGLTVTVIGVGAIGRQAALQLAAIGVNSLQFVDFDVVEVANLAPQGFLEEDLGRLKVEAVADACRRINGGVEVSAEPIRFRRSLSVGQAVFCCVDSIETRRLIWKAVKDRVSFLADTRMSAEVVRVLTVAGAAGREHYPTTLFAAAEAHTGACTAKSTIYTASIAAGLAVGQFTKFLRRLPTECDVTLNLLTAELAVA